MIGYLLLTLFALSFVACEEIEYLGDAELNESITDKRGLSEQFSKVKALAKKLKDAFKKGSDELIAVLKSADVKDLISGLKPMAKKFATKILEKFRKLTGQSKEGEKKPEEKEAEKFNKLFA